ncbi:MAG: DUF364 domain-containing protein [Burkholderiaceae bacterium]
MPEARSTTLHAELLNTLARALAGRKVPRVRALHLPRSPWDGSKDGEFGALELDDGSLGLSYVLLGDSLAALASRSHTPQLIGADALAVAQWWANGQGAQRTLGFAAVNALTRHVFDRFGFTPPPATDSIGGLDPQAGEHIGMIGFFPPLVKQVTACGARLTVLELRPELAGEHAGEHGIFRVTLDARELAGCDKVLSTSTVLLNDTLDEVLARCTGARAFAMIGPGAACLPDPLFERGVSLLGGAWVEDAQAFKQALAAGQPWGAHARKFALARAHYPGIDALLAREPSLS